MVKEVFIISGSENEDYADFQKRLFSIANHYMGIQHINEVRVVLTLQKPPWLSIIPFQKNKIAVLSLYYPDESTIEYAGDINGLIGHYLVEEALVVSYQKTWKDGNITPGTCLLTLFRKKENIDYDTFIDRWHFGHSPLSLKVHPLWHYNRNVVEEELSGSEVWYDGIVEEHVRKPSDLLNPLKFFGGPLIIIPRMITVYRDVKSFIDYGSIKSFLVQEYILKSDPQKYA